MGKILREEAVFYRISSMRYTRVPQNVFVVFLMQCRFRRAAAFHIVSDALVNTSIVITVN